MQQIVIQIDNKILENKIIEISNRMNQSMEKVCIDALYFFINTYPQNNQNELQFTHLNPEEHGVKLDFEIDNNIDFKNAEIFTDIADSAEYIHNLRNKNYR